MIPLGLLSAALCADLISQARRIIGFSGPLFVLFLLAVSGQAQDGQYRLVAKATRPAIEVDGNTQIELTILGLQISDLTKTPLDGLEPGREVLLRGNIGYEPKTPGIKKIGPFEFEFQGVWLQSDTVLVEAGPGLTRGKEGYQFQVFPRKVIEGKPIRVTFRQQYSGKPLVDMQNPSLRSKVRVTKKPGGEKVVETQEPAKSWKSEGSSGTQVGGIMFQLTTWSFDIPTSKTGKMWITRDDLPPLPESIVFDPVEIEVVDTMNSAAPVPVGKKSRQVRPSGAYLTLRVEPRTIQLGESLNLTINLNGVKVADLGDEALPEAPRPYEWSREISFSSHMEFTPETPGVKTYGPFAVEFQGEQIVSNSETIEVVPSWPRDAERYEFRIFPRTVTKGTPIRVTYCEQYSGKPHFDIPYNNPRSPNKKLWSSPGITGWLEDGRKMSRMVSTFDIPSTKVGKRVITREDLPPMDASIVFEPIEVEVIEAK